MIARGCRGDVACTPGLFNAQCSTREAEVKDCIEAAEADAMPGVRDVMNIVKPQDIGMNGTQASKDPGITANSAGILSKVAVTHVVRAVLCPVRFADTAQTAAGRVMSATNRATSLVSCHSPVAAERCRTLRVTRNRWTERARPIRCRLKMVRRKYLDQAELITTTPFGAVAGAVAWSGGFAVLAMASCSPGLVCLDLSDQVNAIAAACSKVFLAMHGVDSTASLPRFSSAPSKVCTAGISLDFIITLQMSQQPTGIDDKGGEYALRGGP